jgi:hypothetical protein
MKKSELIKKLQEEIEGDPDILFSVNNDLFDDDSYFTLLDDIKNTECKKLAIMNENVYEESDEQDLFYNLRNDTDLSDDQVIIKTKELYKERAIINLNCVWRNV